MIKQLHKKLLNKEISAKELAQDYLSRIKKLNPELNAFITITEKETLDQAENVDKIIARGHEIPLLAGIPASIKDVIMIQGVRTTAGSKILENYIAPYDACIVEKLKEQGLVMLGKNNCDEFAMGSSTENSGFGPTKNPHDLTRVPGGTSGGSAAAVAADLSVYSIGSDTGGSVRQPAAFCGVVGLKPTYGAISRFGLIANASSLDQIGVIAKTVEDVRIVFEVIRGRDERDSTSTQKTQKAQKHRNHSANDLAGLKIGIPKEYFVAGIDKEVEKAVMGVIAKAEKLGAEIIQVSLPHTEYALAVYYIIQPAEASANLARYDGIRYGQVSGVPDTDRGQTLEDVYKKTRAEFLGDEVKRRIMLGTYALSAGYYDAYYKKAQQVRTLIRQDFDKIFRNDKDKVRLGFKIQPNDKPNDKTGQVNLLITPTTPTPAWKLGEKIDDPLQMYLQDVFTVPVSIAGLPALSIPAGKTKSGLPIGVQLIGPWLEEERILEVGEVLEKS